MTVKLSSIKVYLAAMQLNTLYRLKMYMGKTEKKDIINNFIYSNFNTAP